jgi:hypothetical protein
MVDIETLGTKPGSVILSIGAVDFGPAPQDGKPFFRSIDVFSSLMAGCSIDAETLAWWRKQSPWAKDAAQPAHGQVSLPAALDAFAKYVEGADEVWAKGPDFDLVLLASVYQHFGARVPWSFRKTRDCRTIYALAGVTHDSHGIDHSAVDDAVGQAKAVLEAYARLGVAL